MAVLGSKVPKSRNPAESRKSCRIQKIQDFAEISTFREKSRFLRFSGFSGFFRISRILQDFGISGLWRQNRGSGSEVPKSCPDRIRDLRSGSAGPEQTCGSGRQVPKPGSDPEILVPGATYRPLSIATSVENDWARGGPFWRSALTLALETVRFLKKIANHKNAQNCRKRYIFFLYPRKSRKIDDFFALTERNMPPFATRRSHGIQHTFSVFLRSQKVEIFALFLAPGRSQNFVSETGFPEIRTFREKSGNPRFRVRNVILGPGVW